MTPLADINLERLDFPDGEALAKGLATRVAERLAGGIKTRGKASILLSGGSTPKRFFAALAEKPLDWSKVFISLVDERWVPPDGSRSNARLIAEHLLIGPAAAAGFVPLYVATGSVDEGLTGVEKNVKALPRPFDVVVLGMGSDGHTASFFPGGDNLNAALDLKSDAELISMRAPGAGEPRITFTLARLLETCELILHIEGAEKAQVLQKALKDGPVAEMPVRAVLRQARPAPVIYWCP